MHSFQISRKSFSDALCSEVERQAANDPVYRVLSKKQRKRLARRKRDEMRAAAAQASSASEEVATKDAGAKNGDA